jgi:hypothetical protein
MQIVNEVGYTNEYLTPPSFVPGLEVLHILHFVRLAQFMLPHLQHK